MVISASRRTDIPSYYSDWFYNRIKEGYVVTRNPMNPAQVKTISLSPDEVDCIVFWSKNPKPMLPCLNELSAYQYYFQFTLTAYADDIETGLPKKTEIIDTFKRLSSAIGAERVIWRYDPIFITPKYSLDYHVQYFGELAKRLKGFTNTVIISFIDLYAKFSKRFAINEMSVEEKNYIALHFSAIAAENNMTIKTCAEEIDLNRFGIEHANCIDGQLIEKLTEKPITPKKDKNQRTACGCVSAVDIGVYNTCLNGCLYCYANYSSATIQNNKTRHNPLLPEMIERCSHGI